MAGSTALKRQKEQKRQEKQRAKAERREQRKTDRPSRADDDSRGQDPDLAGIVPGPQPRAPEGEQAP